jgi:hypothetical protein
MIVTNYTTEDLKKLPLCAIVALTARCARRVERLALLPAEHPEAERCRAAAANAIRLAEDVAKGLSCPSLESVVREVEACRAVVEGDFVRESAMCAVVLTAHAAASAQEAIALRGEKMEPSMFGAPKPNPFPHLADVTADIAARDTFMAAVKATGAGGHSDAMIKAAVADYQKLLGLDLGSYPQAGSPIDPSSMGPLGQL